MVATTTMLGALFGFSMQCTSNALRKYPLYRHPWEHIIAIGLGVGFTTNLVSWTEGQRVLLEENMAKAKELQKKADALGVRTPKMQNM